MPDPIVLLQLTCQWRLNDNAERYWVEKKDKFEMNVDAVTAGLAHLQISRTYYNYGSDSTKKLTSHPANLI